MYRRKATFLLFEILVALSLMGILLSILFSFMVQNMRVDKKMENARKSIIERQNLQIRFQDILTTLAPVENSPSIYTQKLPKCETESLITIFDNGIDPDPLFSGVVIGRIYLDEHKNLCLAYWPYHIHEQNRHWRKETLLTDISDFSFTFLRSSSDARKSLNLWENSWPENNTQAPSIVRLILKQNNGTVQFAFRLVHTHTIPTWIRST
ncbi:MAG TPA: type II secretion system protein [Chlamydiales bacterium]|nr:type II secretion system protein [Chlamydiales bacterium]